MADGCHALARLGVALLSIGKLAGDQHQQADQKQGVEEAGHQPWIQGGEHAFVGKDAGEGYELPSGGRDERG